MNKAAKKTRIAPSATVKEAMARLDAAGEQVLLVTDSRNVLVGTLTDGDIRRHILADRSLQDPVSKVCNPSPLTLGVGASLLQARQLMLEHRIEQIPVVDGKRRVVDLLLWDGVLGDHVKDRAKPLGIPVVIMAGGRGGRLDPFTRILPKPLIPMDERPIIQVIMERFLEFGCRRFLLTVNYKAQMIRSYFDGDERPRGIKLEFIEEKEETGTAGSLALLTRRLKGDFFLSNCDVLVKADYGAVLHHHRSCGNVITVVASMQNFRVPYGVIDLGPAGGLKRIIEKPEYDLLANTGVYVVSSRVFQLLPKKSAFNMNDLIARVMERGGKVGVFPVTQGAWKDVGQWVDYFRNVLASNVGRDR